MHRLCLIFKEISVRMDLQKKSESNKKLSQAEIKVLRDRLNRTISELKCIENICHRFKLPINFASVWYSNIRNRSLARQNVQNPGSDFRQIVRLALEVAKDLNMDLFNRYVVKTADGVLFYLKFEKNNQEDYLFFVDFLRAEENAEDQEDRQNLPTCGIKAFVN